MAQTAGDGRRATLQRGGQRSAAASVTEPPSARISRTSLAVAFRSRGRRSAASIKPPATSPKASLDAQTTRARVRLWISQVSASLP